MQRYTGIAPCSAFRNYSGGALITIWDAGYHSQVPKAQIHVVSDTEIFSSPTVAGPLSRGNFPSDVEFHLYPFLALEP